MSKESLINIAYKNKEIITNMKISDYTKRLIDDDLRLLYTFNSNKIEGNSLSLNETKIIIKDHLAVGGKSINDHMQAINHNKAINLLFEEVKNKTPITIDLMKKFNEILLTNDELHHDDRGLFRGKNQIAIISGSSGSTSMPEKIVEDMNSLLSEYNDFIKDPKKIIQATAFFHSGFELIHPFCDGNGRTGRLLLNLELMKNDFPMTIIRDSDRVKYYDALDLVSTDKTLEPLSTLIAESIIKSQERMINILQLPTDLKKN